MRCSAFSALLNLKNFCNSLWNRALPSYRKFFKCTWWEMFLNNETRCPFWFVTLNLSIMFTPWPLYLKTWVHFTKLLFDYFMFSFNVPDLHSKFLLTAAQFTFFHIKLCFKEESKLNQASNSFVTENKFLWAHCYTCFYSIFVSGVVEQ